MQLPREVQSLEVAFAPLNTGLEELQLEEGHNHLDEKGKGWMLLEGMDGNSLDEKDRLQTV